MHPCFALICASTRPPLKTESVQENPGTWCRSTRFVRSVPSRYVNDPQYNTLCFPTRRGTMTMLLAKNPQTRKTKEDQLRKKMQETQRSSSAREMMFALEKAKRERLEATMHHFEQHMHQRELTLAEKVWHCRDNATLLFAILLSLSPHPFELQAPSSFWSTHLSRATTDYFISPIEPKAPRKELFAALSAELYQLAGETRKISLHFGQKN